MKGLAVALGRAVGEIEQVPEELGVEAAQRAGAGAAGIGAEGVVDQAARGHRRGDPGERILNVKGDYGTQS